MRDPVRHFISEFIGIFALVFIGGATIMSTGNASPGVGLVAVALAHGLALGTMISALMRISGHFNPAVTLGFLVTRRIEPMMGALYIVAQLIGAIAATYALKAIFPAAAFIATSGGGQTVSELVTSGQAFLAELIATFFLMIAVMGTAADPKGPKVGGLVIGLVVTMDILAIGPVTGGSMNPARSFGPAVVTQSFTAQGIYWAGPIVGAVLAAVIYDLLFLRATGNEPADHGELKP
jgi:MIP family channel proteins